VYTFHAVRRLILYLLLVHWEFIQVGKTFPNQGTETGQFLPRLFQKHV